MEVGTSIAIKTFVIADQDLEELEVTKLVLSTCVDCSPIRSQRVLIPTDNQR